MPAANTTDSEIPASLITINTDASSIRLRNAIPVNTPQENRSITGRLHRRESQDIKPYSRERKKSQCERELPGTPSDAITTSATSITTTTTTTATKQRSSPPPTDPHDARSGRTNQPEVTSESDTSDTSYDKVASDELKEEGQPSIAKVPASTKITRISVADTSQPASYAQATHSSKDHQHPPPGAAEGTIPRGNIASRPAGRPPNAQHFPGHLQMDEQQEMSEVGRQQGPNYSGGVMGTIMSFMPAGGPPPPKDKYQILKDDFRRVQNELENYKRELRRCHGEIRSANHYIQELHHDKQRWKDHMGGMQHELTSVYQQLEDAKTLSEVRGKELFGAQVFLTKADTLSISEVGEKVTALNEEIFQAAATLGEALTHQRHDLPQEELDAAAAESQEMVGEKISNLLIGQAQKPEPEVNPLLVQVVLQIFMVKFCVSKIQSWYPGDNTVAGFLDAIYSEIRLTEEQAVSGRWRALTRAHTRPTTDTWTNELSKKLLSVLKIAAWNPGSTEHQESFKHRLPPIFKAVNELRVAIGEKFTSADLEISVFDCNTVYESSYMEDAYGDGRQQPSGKRVPEIVVGTTGIGLKKLMAERGVNDTLRFQSVISAKIVLESTLKEALEPVQSSGGKLRKTRKKPAENADSAEPEGRGNPGSKSTKTGYVDK